MDNIFSLLWWISIGMAVIAGLLSAYAKEYIDSALKKISSSIRKKNAEELIKEGYEIACIIKSPAYRDLYNIRVRNFSFIAIVLYFMAILSFFITLGSFGLLMLSDRISERIAFEMLDFIIILIPIINVLITILLSTGALRTTKRVVEMQFTLEKALIELCGEESKLLKK